MNQVKAWHFVGAELRDGRPVPEDGMLLKHSGRVKLCESGFHGSLSPFDGLQYAPGSILCRTLHSGVIVHGDDKLVSSERLILYRADITPLLQYFARQQALKVVHLWDAPQVVLDFLMGDESKRAAAWAAWAALEAAWAARAAAWAAREAAREAAWAARAAAWAARAEAAAAARAAAKPYDKSIAESKAEFDALVYEHFNEERT